MAVNFAQFLSGIPSPVDRLEEGVLSGQNQQLNTQKIEQNDVILENQRAEQQAAQAAAQQKAVLNAELVSLSQNPNRTAKDLQDIIIRNPGLADSFKAPLAQMNNEQRQVSLNEAINVKAALSVGNTEKAVQILEDRKEAALNSGDQQEADKSDIMIKTITANPDAAGTMIDMFIAANDPDKFAEVSGALQDQAQDAALNPLNREQLRAEIDKTKADTTKIINESGLQVAEYKSVTQNPDGSSTGINTLNGKLEIIPVGDEPLPATKAQLEATNKLIDTAKKDKRIDNFIQVSSNNDRITSALDSAAGDISLIFAFMKMLDPGSTVREGEFATAQNSGSVNENIWASYNKAVTGERLVPSRRADFKGQAKAIFDGSRKTAEKALEPIKAHAERFNIRGETIEEAVFGIPEDEVAAPTIDIQEGQSVVQDGNIFERQTDGSMKFIGKQ